MEFMYKLKSKLFKELEEMAEKSNYNIADVEEMHVLTDTIKNICKIMMLEDGGGYSHDGDWEARGSYERGNSSRRKRDSMGRYSRDDGYSRDGYSRESSYARRMYSRDDAKSRMVEQMESMMDQASNDRDREAIKRCVEQLENS